MITEALVLLGVCGFLGSVIFSRLYGRMRKDLIRTGLIGICIALSVWEIAASQWWLMLGACMMLGVFSTLFNITFQAELLKLVSLGASTVAMSIFSGIFNLGIGSGTWFGGRLVNSGHLPVLGMAGAGIAAVALFLCLTVYLPKVARNGK